MDFCMNMNTKSNRRKLVRALFTVPRQRYHTHYKADSSFGRIGSGSWSGLSSPFPDKACTHAHADSEFGRIWSCIDLCGNMFFLFSPLGGAVAPHLIWNGIKEVNGTYAIVKLMVVLCSSRLDLLPFYSRLVATLHPCMSDVADDLCSILKGDFRFHVGPKTLQQLLTPSSLLCISYRTTASLK